MAQVNDDPTSRDLPRPALFAKNLDLRWSFAAKRPQYNDLRIYTDQRPRVRPE
jgi:hypothetical protein